MIETVLDILSWGLLIFGGALVILGAIGVWRFPDFYTRLHAAGVTDTFGADLVLLAMALQANDFIVMTKLFFIFVFLILTSPVSTHAIAHAALVGGLRPRLGEDMHQARRESDVNPDRAGGDS